MRTTTLPTHVLHVDEVVPSLLLQAHTAADTVMAVRMPSGEVLCNDDSGGADDAQLVFAAAAGRYYTGSRRARSKV